MICDKLNLLSSIQHINSTGDVVFRVKCETKLILDYLETIFTLQHRLGWVFEFVSVQVWRCVCTESANYCGRKTREMESFVVFRKHLAMSGIIEQNSKKKSRVIALSCLYLIAVSKLLGEAKTFDEYTNVIYRVVFVCFMSLFYLIVVWKSPEFDRLIETLEDAVNKRKHQHKISVV